MSDALPDHNDYGDPCDHRAAWEAVTTHTRTVNGIGPDHCEECSAAIREWVPWPCPRAERSTDRALIRWLVETVHYPFDFSFDVPPPIDHHALADHWNEWDHWRLTHEEAYACVAEEAGLTSAAPPAPVLPAAATEGEGGKR